MQKMIMPLSTVAVLLLVGCTKNSPAPNQVPESAPSQTTEPQTSDAAVPPGAVATLNPTAGNQVSGTINYDPVDGGVRVHGTVTGLTPGKHGFHIHETGDCSSPDGKSAGGHFNPEGVAHGGPDAAVRHVGDMGNLTADDSGSASIDYTDAHLALDGEYSIIGRGLIVHAKEDDLTSQPTGAAGARVACGVIKPQ